jgi:ADP-ribose pyrophosphatase YjhB (NUDIX family)
LYLGALLSKPVVSSPVVIVSPSSEESRESIAAFRSHFEHYWRSSQYWISTIALADNGDALLVKNDRDVCRWPTGFVDPDEDLETGVIREFAMETGYEIGRPVQLAATPEGYFFVARLGSKSQTLRGRRAVFIVRELPKESTGPLSDQDRWVQLLDQARAMQSNLPPASRLTLE